MELGGRDDWGRHGWRNTAAHCMQLFSGVRLSKRWSSLSSFLDQIRSRKAHVLMCILL